MTLGLVDQAKIEEKVISWCASVVVIPIPFACRAGTTPATFARHVGE
jgi:hypothetical protein